MKPEVHIQTKEHAIHLAKSLGLRFIQPSEYFKDRNIIQKTQGKIDKMASILGVRTISIFPPSIGFLNRPPSVNQKRTLNEELGSSDAAKSIERVDEILPVKVEEKGEQMVPLDGPSGIFAQHNIRVTFSTNPYSPACWESPNIPRQRIFWVRKGVAEKLVNAGKALNEIGLMMHVEDAFRPADVQAGLLKRRIQLTAKEHPHWTTNQVLQESRSKTATTPKEAGHIAGAAVDISLREINSQKGSPFLDVGNKYAEGGILVSMDSPFVTQQQWANRQIFAKAMELAGLTLYPGENWHASDGDSHAGRGKGKKYIAKYGPIKGFDPQTGTIYPYEENIHNPLVSAEIREKIIADAKDNLSHPLSQMQKEDPSQVAKEYGVKDLPEMVFQILKNANPQKHPIIVEGGHIYANTLPGSESQIGINLAQAISSKINTTNAPIIKHMFVDDYTKGNSMLEKAMSSSMVKDFDPQLVLFESDFAKQAIRDFPSLSNVVNSSRRAGITYIKSHGKSVPIISGEGKPLCAFMDASRYYSLHNKHNGGIIFVTILPKDYPSQQHDTLHVLEHGYNTKVKVINVYFDGEKAEIEHNL